MNILNAGTKTLNGLSYATLVFKDLLPSSEVFGFLEQTSGAAWNWFSISVRFPDLVIGPTWSANAAIPLTYHPVPDIARGIGLASA